MPQSFLVCGNSRTLLITRCLVLEHLGMHTEAVLGLAELPETIAGALVLCHTLGEDGQVEVIKGLRAKQPAIPILRVGDGQLSGHDGLLEVSDLDGPKAFVDAARKLTQ